VSDSGNDRVPRWSGRLAKTIIHPLAELTANRNELTGNVDVLLQVSHWSAWLAGSSNAWHGQPVFGRAASEGVA